MIRNLAFPVVASLAVACLLAAAAGPASAQDWRVLEDHRVIRPEVKPAIAPLAATPTVTRVLLAGDSWAQYMWDDGSHNDLFDRFGHQDKRALSLSLGSEPGPGHVGPEYSVSGSEARHWVDTANYPWIANLTAALAANPAADLVMLSIGGNDVLAGRPDAGWYKDMDLDVPGSEAALFDRIRTDTEAVVNAALAVRPDVEVVLSSYDYPNFNVGFWCFLYACPKRNDLSRDPVGDLITDEELNQMMVTVEGYRIGWTNGWPRVHYDHAVGLMHYFYGDGVSAAETLPYPGQDPPGYAPFPGGNALRPTLRSNFRRPSGIDADPIHLDYDAYQYKIANQTATHFFPRFRGPVTESLVARGAGNDGWTDGLTAGTTEVRVGRGAGGTVHGIVSFDTASIPDGASVTGASLYLHRKGASGTNPFISGALGALTVDVVGGTFGPAGVDVADATAPADAYAVGSGCGSARENGYSIRIDLDAAGLAAIDDAGITEFRIRFDAAVAGAEDHAAFEIGGGAGTVDYGVPTLAEYMGTASPFLDVTYDGVTAVPGDDPVAAAPRLLPNTPNPFRASTTLPFTLPTAAPVRIRVFDVAGRLVDTLADRTYEAGSHHLVWDGRDAFGRRLPAGIYLARMEAGEASAVRRLVLR